MEINKILTADILDIIFEGRNKDYGAYDLRKTYNKRLRIALLVTAVVVLLLLRVPDQQHQGQQEKSGHGGAGCSAGRY